MTTRLICRALTLAVLAGAVLAPSGLNARSSDSDIEQTLAFAAEMARKGNWREARYRWQQADSRQPNNPRVLNNLAVAAEVLGDAESAETYYERALTLDGRDPRIAENSQRFRALRDEERRAAEGSEPSGADGSAIVARASGRLKVGRNTFRVATRFQLPPRLDLTNFENILVASFLTEENDLLDTNREITRYLRGRFRKKSSLEVLDVVPPPAVPEQTAADLVANSEFWRHLGREYDAHLIVSGVVLYKRRDTSGYGDVDVVSQVTGQKVRETRFIEQEQFTYSMEVFFMNGRTGELEYRDRLQRSATYPGTSNDPLTAFYDLVESITGDVLSVVSNRTREGTRIVFRS